VTVTPPAPDAAPAPVRRAAAASIDWEGAVDAAWELLFTGTAKRSVDISAFRIPKTKESIDYLFSFFWFTPRFLRIGPTKYDYKDGYLTTLSNIGEKATDPVANRAKYDACTAAIDRLLDGIRDDASLSGMEKCLLTHDRLAAWVSYPYDAYLNGTLSDDAFSAYGPLALHTGVCNGYALAYNWMLEELGIRSWYTSSAKLDHGWSLVELDGTLYYTDVTWDDPSYDIPGRVLHENFLQSFATFSAGHNHATDFDQTPSSTLYETGFYIGVQSEIVRIGTTWYYFDAEGQLIERLADGTASVVQAVRTEREGTGLSPKLIAIDSTILYLTPRSVRAFDTRTGQDTLYYTPDAALFPTDSFFLNGIRQQDGTVYITSTDDETGAFDAGTVAAHTESFAFCDHSYTAQLANDETLLTAATCTEPAVYVCACAVCGTMDPEKSHVFTAGTPLGHDWAWVTDTAPTCAAAGERHEACSRCTATRNEQTPIEATGHSDADGDGYCDDCETDLLPGRCAYCGKVHTGFFGLILGFFHRILALFQ